MTYLTPDDVAKMLGIGRRLAFRLMREAGAIVVGRDLRVSEERRLQWVEQRAMGCSNEGASGTSATRHRPAVWSLTLAAESVLARRAP